MSSTSRRASADIGSSQNSISKSMAELLRKNRSKDRSSKTVGYDGPAVMTDVTSPPGIAVVPGIYVTLPSDNNDSNNNNNGINYKNTHWSKKKKALGADRPRSRSELVPIPLHILQGRSSTGQPLQQQQQQQKPPSRLQVYLSAGRRKSNFDGSNASPVNSSASRRGSSGQDSLSTPKLLNCADEAAAARSRSPSVGPSEFVEMYRSRRRATLDLSAAEHRRSGGGSPQELSPIRPIGITVGPSEEDDEAFTTTELSDDINSFQQLTTNYSSSMSTRANRPQYLAVPDGSTPPGGVKQLGPGNNGTLTPPECLYYQRRASHSPSHDFSNVNRTLKGSPNGTEAPGKPFVSGARRHSEPAVEAAVSIRSWKSRFKSRTHAELKSRQQQQQLDDGDPLRNYPKRVTTGLTTKVRLSPDAAEQCDQHLIIWVDRQNGTQVFTLPTGNEDETAVPQPLQLGGNGEDDLLFTKLAKRHKCHELMPLSAQLVVVDKQLRVSSALDALAYNGIKAAPIWDSDVGDFVGMLTITDFIGVLLHFTSAEKLLEQVDESRISEWRDLLRADLKPMVTIDAEDSVYDAVQRLTTESIHRLLVVDGVTGHALFILTAKRILQYLAKLAMSFPFPCFMSTSIYRLEVGTFDNLATVEETTPLLVALRLFAERHMSSLPVVDNCGRIVNIYTKYDVINLTSGALDKTLSSCTIRDAIHDDMRESFEGLYTCSRSTSLASVVKCFYKNNIHRIVVIDDEKRVNGIVSLSDVLKHLVLGRVNSEISVL